MVVVGVRQSSAFSYQSMISKFYSAICVLIGLVDLLMSAGVRELRGPVFIVGIALVIMGGYKFLESSF